jgi:NAD(P)-dependent dehydrogenase (short-subunit alcohol dehydrogenase family)
MVTAPLAFAGQIALITGASRGIGAALAKSLAAQGAHVLLVARTIGGLEATEAAIHQSGGQATLVPLDLTKGDDIDQLGQAVATRWGRLDILLLNAAILGPLSPLAHVPPNDFDAVVASNLTANYRLLRAFDGGLRQSTRGRVLALSSSVARAPRGYWGPYAATKAALETLLLCYSDEVARITPIRVGLVNPGRTRTGMRTQAFPSEDPASLPTPEARAAQITAFLESDFVSGSYLDLEHRSDPIRSML